MRIGWARQLQDRLSQLQLGCWKELQVHDIRWTLGDMIAIRIFNEAAQLLDKRRLTGDWFDVTPELAQQAIRIAHEKLSVPTFSHGEMLEKVRSIRKSRLDAIVKGAKPR